MAFQLMSQTANKERLLMIPDYIMWKDRALSLFQSGWDHLLGYSDSPKDSPVFVLGLKQTRQGPQVCHFSAQADLVPFGSLKKKNKHNKTIQNQQTSVEKGSLSTMKWNILSNQDICCIAKIFPAICCLTNLFLISDTMQTKTPVFPVSQFHHPGFWHFWLFFPTT